MSNFYDFLIEKEFLEEVAPKKTKVVRDGKRQIKYKCPAGYKLVGNKCVKMSSSEKLKRSKVAKKMAKKRTTSSYKKASKKALRSKKKRV